VHVPGLDPLTNADSEARQKFYGDEIEGTPTAFVNGVATTPLGGKKALAEQRYASLRELVAKAVEEDAGAKLQLKVERKGDKIDVSASVDELETTGEKVKLRVALVEEVVRYAGANGQRLHRHVVRALVAPPGVKGGGPAGVVMKQKSGTYKVTIDVAEVRKSVSGYLDGVVKSGRQFQTPGRPLELKKLKVVAFIQADDSKEVFQAAQVDVPDGAAAKEEKRDKK
jgi:hypothetical protein